MPTNIAWIPTSNIPMNGDYTGLIQVGSQSQPVSVILDTGSSTLGIGRHVYDPAQDTDKILTDFAQVVAYGNGSVGWYGAVVETNVTIGIGGSTLDVPRCNVASASHASASMFGNAGGILGLAYTALNDAYQMPGPTWPLKYSTKNIQKLGVRKDLSPYFTQLAQSAGIADLFAFYSLRSWPNLVMADPKKDPLNQGWLILGGGPESTKLYTGEFQNAKVVGDDFYDTNLKAVIVGNQPPISVPPAPMAGPGTLGDSNSIVDSGTNSLVLDGELFTQVVSAFTAINASFGPLIQKGGTQSNGTQGVVSNAEVQFLGWPKLQFVLEGEGGVDVTLTLAPETYWQTNAVQPGMAAFTMSGGAAGQSILGLPLLNNYYTVFDQTGTGTIRFATIAQPQGGVLPQPGPG